VHCVAAVLDKGARSKEQEEEKATATVNCIWRRRRQKGRKEGVRRRRRRRRRKRRNFSANIRILFWAVTGSCKKPHKLGKLVWNFKPTRTKVTFRSFFFQNYACL
jgi:hypothetical protein